MQKNDCSTGTVPSATKRMAATKGRDNPRELAIRSALHRRGLRFRVHCCVIPGTKRTVDILFPKSKTAVFLDGCFWHNCPEHGTWPKSNSKWWSEKLLANKARDENTNKRLKEAGWKVIRVWEHHSVDEAFDIILTALKAD